MLCIKQAVFLALTLILARGNVLPGHCSKEQFMKSANAIVKENCLEGTDSRYWDVNGAGDPDIQGELLQSVVDL